MISFNGIGAGIGNFAVATYNTATALTESVGSIALNILNKAPWFGPGAKAAIDTALASWANLAAGGATIVLGTALLVGTVLLVTKVVIPFFQKEEAPAK